MKYISVVLLIVLMSWTWCMATSDRPFSLENHKRVEAGVEEDIRAFIKRRFPDTTDIFCQQLYTEDVVPGVDMVAHFRCQNIAQGTVADGATDDFDDSDLAEQVFEGHIKLHSNDNFATWAETGGEIVAKETTFLNGIKVTPEKGGTKPDGTPKTAPKEKSE